MAIKALSYIGVNSDKFEDWSDYTQKSLGMQQVDRGKDILSFRMDDQKQRLTITGDTGDGLGFMGWEVDVKEDLLFYASKLEENKIEYSKGTIYLGTGHSTIFQGGKIDIQTSIRALCRQEIEYALWNYTSKLIENNSNDNLLNNLKTTNIDSFRLKWFLNKSFPIKDITLNGFPIGTDDTARLTCKANGDVVVGSETGKPVNLNVYGNVGIGVKYPQETLHVDGNIKFAERTFASGEQAPKEGRWDTGSVIWNEKPALNQPVGWVCTNGGKPGSWRAFGMVY